MDYFQTNVNNNYAKFNSHYHMGAFTKYGCFRQNNVQAINEWQPKAVPLFSFIATSYFLKPVYFGTTGAVNWVQLNKLWQYNKPINVDRFYTPRRFTLLCVKPSSYFKRYATLVKVR